MPKLVRIFFTGMFISFLGSLPLGTLNIATMQISISEGFWPAFWFSLGCLATELVYVRISIIAMDWVRRQQNLFRFLEWVTLLIVLALAAGSFYAAMHPDVKSNFILDSTINKFLLGMMMCAVNPVQIPFWFGWSTVLFTKKILEPKSSHYNSYIAGIGFGTLLGNFVFIYGGQLVADKISSNESLLNWIIGGIFLLTALIQVYKMFRHKGAEHRIEHPEEHTRPFEETVEEIAQESTESK